MSLTKRSLLLAAALAPALFLARATPAQRPKPKIAKDSAEAIARAQVPDGKIVAAEYEHEKGRWIWSMELKVKGKSGIEEINVDAMTGKVVSHEHESPRAEAKEQKAEKKTPKP